MAPSNTVFQTYFYTYVLQCAYRFLNVIVMTRIANQVSTHTRLSSGIDKRIYSFKLKTNSEIFWPGAPRRYGWCEKTNGYLLLTNDADVLSTRKRWKIEMSSRNHGDLFIVILSRASSKKGKRAYLYSLFVDNTYFISQKKKKPFLPARLVQNVPVTHTHIIT